MTAQLDVAALVGRLRRQGRIGIFAASLDGAKIVDYDDAANALETLLAHIAGEDARVAAAVAGERERCAVLAEVAIRSSEKDDWDAGCSSAARNIAAAIRKTPRA